MRAVAPGSRQRGRNDSLLESKGAPDRQSIGRCCALGAAEHKRGRAIARIRRVRSVRGRAVSTHLLSPQPHRLRLRLVVLRCSMRQRRERDRLGARSRALVVGEAALGSSLAACIRRCVGPRSPWASTQPGSLSIPPSRGRAARPERPALRFPRLDTPPQDQCVLQQA